MTGSVKTYTPNFKMIIPEFNVATWHDYIEENFRNIDALFHNLFGINGFSGMWKTNTTYKANQVLFVGEDNGSEYEGRLVKVIQDTNTAGFTTFSEAIKRYPSHYEMYADASSAEVFATLAQDWATKTGSTIKTPTGEDTGEYSAKYHAQLAAQYKEACEMYRNLAKTDADLAKESEVEATNQAEIATTQATNAKTSENNALSYKNSSKTYAQSAQNYLQQAQIIVNNFDDHAQNLQNTFDSNAVSKTTSYNDNASSKSDEYNQNHDSKTTAFNNNYTIKLNSFNTNATEKTNQVNTIATNVSTLVNGFDENVETNTNEFNQNATNKTTSFDLNATQKTNAFNSNALSKTNTFNSNADSKTQAFNTNASEKQSLIDAAVLDAQTSATNAETSETNAKTSENNAKSYSEQAESSATTATQMSSSASDYATIATTQAEIATNQAGIATTKAQNASESEATATSKANIATTKAQEANTSATNASSSATSASNSASLAESWAIGDNVSRPEGSAKYWAEQASAGQLQADWNQTDTIKKDFIKNKPTKLSQFTNDTNFVNTTQLATKQDKLTTTQLNSVNSGITSDKVSAYDGYQTQINNRQLTSNLSQTIDESTSKYPSNAAVKAAIDAKDSLPSQTGNSGKFLTTNGTTASWGTVDLTSKANVSLDNVNPSQSFKKQSVNWGMPDYANRVSKSTGTNYTAERNGYLWLYYSASGDTKVTIDGLTFNNAGNTTTATVLYPVKKGSTYSFSGGGSYGFSCYFIPAIGG